MLRRQKRSSSASGTEDLEFVTRRSRFGNYLGRMTSKRADSYIRNMSNPIPLGTRGEAETTVEFKNTLTAWKEHLPPVYSTPNMIGLMEAAAYNALEPFCEGDEVSVGTAINIVHRAASTMGMKIKTEAVLESFDGRFYTFKVSAHNGIEVIGHGTIARAIVSKAKFEEKQRQKQKTLAAD
jgi:fluoroacetyl-CoA thioesterase